MNVVGHTRAKTTAERLEEWQYDLTAPGDRSRYDRRLYGSATPLEITSGRDLRRQFGAPPVFLETYIATRLNSSSHPRKAGTRGEPFCRDTRRLSKFANVATKKRRGCVIRNPVPVMLLTADLKSLPRIIHQGQRSARRGLTAVDDATLTDLKTPCTAAQAGNPCNV